MFKIIFSFATETAMGEYFPGSGESLCLIRLVIAQR
jgi:hypothetical protein